MGRLDTKVAIVTGSAEGIGKATAILFGKEGAKVVVADINETKGKEVVDEINSADGDAIFFLLDVTNETQWKDLMETTIKKFGRLNVIVNNAGISRAKDIENTSLKDWNEIMGVNATGVFLGTKYA
ncbi:MAG: SDR family NAD(P)-dependent oxidoreductase, partial [Desulfobacterales bacterium]